MTPFTAVRSSAFNFTILRVLCRLRRGHTENDLAVDGAGRRDAEPVILGHSLLGRRIKGTLHKRRQRLEILDIWTGGALAQSRAGLDQVGGRLERRLDAVGIYFAVPPAARP